MFCSISGKVPETPVVSRKSGHLFEKSLIEKYLHTEEKCPVTGEDLTVDDLLPIESSKTMIKPRPLPATSIPGLLGIFQNEWDDMMLEAYSLKQHLDATRKELSQALYQHDAACRVIARLVKERDEAKAKIGQMQKQLASASMNINGDSVEDMNIDNEIPESVLTQITEKSSELSKYRKNDRVQSNSLATSEVLMTYKVKNSNTIHKSDKPGITCVDIDPKDSSLIVTGGIDKDAKIFNHTTGKVIATLTGHSKKLSDVAFHASADVVITCSHDKSAKIWNRSNESSYAVASTVDVHSAAVTGCALHATGDYLAISSLDATWSFSDLRSGRCLKHVKDSNVSGGLECIAFHPDGVILGTGTSDNLIRIWDMKTQMNVASFEGHTDVVHSIDFSENGYYMASGGKDGFVRLWDLRKLRNFLNLTIEAPVHSVNFEHSGCYLGVGAADVRVFKESGKRQWDLVKTFDDHNASVTGVKLSRDLEFITSVSMDRSLKVYSV